MDLRVISTDLCGRTCIQGPWLLRRKNPLLERARGRLAAAVFAIQRLLDRRRVLPVEQV